MIYKCVEGTELIPNPAHPPGNSEAPPALRLVELELKHTQYVSVIFLSFKYIVAPI